MSLFFLFLGIAAWQDLRTRSISLEVLTAGAAAGMAVCVLEGRGLEEIVPAMIPGIALLLINRFADGIIGEGDGLFFLVAGFFLEWKEIVLLLISGQFFCGIFGLAMAVSVMTIGGGKIGGGNGNLRKMRLPFLPFLLPTALWMAVMRVL